MILREYQAKDEDQCVAGAMSSLPHEPGYDLSKLQDWQARYYFKTLDPNKQLCLVLEHEETGEIAGAITAYCITSSVLASGKIATNQYTYLKPEYRNLGNLVALISGYIKWAKGKGVKPDSIRFIYDKRLKFSGLLEKLGFELAQYEYKLKE